jgi:5-formyltetrahydrofolate cyclo-ligase
MEFDLIEAKKKARLNAANARESAHLAMQAVAPLALLEHSFPVVAAEGRCVVSGFYPYQSEIDTRPLLGRLAGGGWTTCLPIVLALREPLVFRRWYPGEPTVTGRWAIPRPTDDAALVTPDVLLVPLLAFDRSGYRLGYGGGFYDRTLQMLRADKPVIAIGVAYAGQEVATVPHDGSDQPMDYMMTEKEVFRCG